MYIYIKNGFIYVICVYIYMYLLICIFTYLCTYISLENYKYLLRYELLVYGTIAASGIWGYNIGTH